MGKFHVWTNLLAFDWKFPHLICIKWCFRNGEILCLTWNFPHTCLVTLFPTKETTSGHSSEASANNWGNFMSDINILDGIWHENFPKKGGRSFSGEISCQMPANILISGIWHEFSPQQNSAAVLLSFDYGRFPGKCQLIKFFLWCKQARTWFTP